MAIRKVTPKSDRGSLKDLVAVQSGEVEAEEAPTPFELRLKNLYESSRHNKEMQASLGFITTDYIGDKNAIPLSAYRIREVVKNIKSKSGDVINLLSQQMSGYITGELTDEAVSVVNNYNKRGLIRTASTKKPPVFWRARKS